MSSVLTVGEVFEAAIATADPTQVFRLALEPTAQAIGSMLGVVAEATRNLERQPKRLAGRSKLSASMEDNSDAPSFNRCTRCGGLNGAHGLVHERYGNGGGGNKPCPNDSGVIRADRIDKHDVTVSACKSLQEIVGVVGAKSSFDALVDAKVAEFSETASRVVATGGEPVDSTVKACSSSSFPTKQEVTQ
jgi:hypothetical protein